MLFIAKVINKNNSKESTVFIQKESHAELIKYFEKKNIIPISIHKMPSFFNFLYKNIDIFNINDNDVIFLFENLSTSLKAGIPIVSILTDLEQEVKKTNLKQIIKDITDDIENGYTFVEACKKYPKVFKPHILRVLEIGQESNRFVVVLDDIISTLKNEQEIKKNVKQALIYPSIALSIIIGVFLFWGVYVIPNIVTNLSASNLELPSITISIINLFDYLKMHWTTIIPIMFISILFMVITIKRSTYLQETFSKILLNLPYISTFIKEYYMIVVSKYLYLILQSGKPLSHGLELLINNINNISYKNELKSILNDIYNGEKLSETIKESELFSNLMYRMVLTGEHGNNLKDELNYINNLYTKKLSDSTKTITKFIEPIMTVMLGALIIILIISFLAPIYDLITSFSY